MNRMIDKKTLEHGHDFKAMRFPCIVGIANCWGCMAVDASEIPECFRVLGTTVPADKQNPPTHGFTEKMPETHLLRLPMGEWAGLMTKEAIFRIDGERLEGEKNARKLIYNEL